ncbi:MAG TPA: amidase family protein [Candidatus Thermoplasmatota archaeon]|nr:amidase family protein [Candidatus Thermoplasmatota archaeon]
MQRKTGWIVGVALAVLASGCVAPQVVGPASAGAAADAAEPDCYAVVNGINLHHATIADLQAALTAGTITSVQLVDAYVARVAAYDNGGPLLNSIQEISASAHAQALALDQERAAGRVRGPLHGMPILLKDNVGTVDEPTTAGALSLAGNVPPQDATLTERLRAAGAIILGKTQLSEFANWVSLTMPNGYSSLGGQVYNAYTGGDPSGSSAGSGVAGSMAFSAATIGTETSGSILSPSNANSLVGVKPTVGLVSRAGVIPLAANFDTPGPMVRNVADAALVLGAIAGPDPRDPATAESAGHLPANNDYAALLRTDALQGVRLGYEANANAIFQTALYDLEAQGATLVEIDDHDLDTISLLEIGLIPNEFKFGLNQYLATEAGPGLPVHDLTAIVLYNLDHPDEYAYGQDLLIASDLTPGLGPLADATALPVIAANRLLADKLFEDNDVDALIGLNAPWTGLGAAAGYPTVTVPAGYAGVDPRGLSFFGPRWSEAALLGYAFAYEQASHRRVAPTDISDWLLEGVCDGGAAAPSAADATPTQRAQGPRAIPGGRPSA